MNNWLIEFLNGAGLSPDTARIAADLVEIALVAIAAAVSYHLANRVMLHVVARISRATQTDWDDRLVERGVFGRVAHVLPAFVIYVLAPAAFTTPGLVMWSQRAAGIYAITAALLTFTLVLSVGNEIYDEFEIARRFPIRVYVQVVKILLTAGAAIICISIVTGQSPLLLLSGLGAMTAILLLISKDSIQGLLAGIQLVSNDMVRPGDWIEMPQYGADGDVMDITLHTVKVRNFDNTITTIPTYALISHSFKNWRGMAESSGRRIKRSILIDISSVRFLTPEMFVRFKRIELVADYLEGLGSEIEERSQKSDAEGPLPDGSRRLTNLGVFRRYVVAYLRLHPDINKELTLMARQLQPTAHGVPLELYTFSADKKWVNYEGIQADIFDHLFACLHEFDLRAYQMPSGHDAVDAIQGLSARRSNG